MGNHEDQLTSEELKQLRRQYQLILNAVGEGVYGLDLDGNATFVNPAAAAMIGWDVEDLIGKSMHAVLHHSHPDGCAYPREECPIYAAFHDGVIHRVTNEVFWRKDGTQFPVEYISTPMRDEQGQLIGAVVAFRDITQRKWAESVLQRANEELELKVQERTSELRDLNSQLKELNELKSRFVAMVCHEFRNPLNNISLSLSSFKRYEAQLSLEQKHDYLSGIAENVDRMTQMIDDILVISKIEARRLEVQHSRLDAVAFCQGLIDELSTTFNRAIALHCRRKSLRVDLDAQLLRSILTNILTNAIHYSPDGSPIALKLFCHKHYVVFQVTDQGIGILEGDRPSIFEPFQRGKNVSNIPGTGLGLNIVKRFVDLQQGKIEVESEPGQGTTFRV
ncbi:MAG: ATP-binding protein, partial [Leptolyngbyaceae bacterium]|nr:ATP-binding protein [Leptolyngbyaceae bacterium]